MQKKCMSVGLCLKTDDNDLEDYNNMMDTDVTDTGPIPALLENIKKHPEQYFNFGFTYNDFRSYLMKIMYCRALRKFIETKRLERIEDFQKANSHAIVGGLIMHQ